MKYLLRISLALVSSISFLLFLIATRIPLKAIFFTPPNRKDARRFPANTIATGSNSFSFKTSTENWGKNIKVNDWTTDVPVFNSLNKLFKQHKTNAFLLIQKDTILYETYSRGHHQQTLHPSYSIAKSFTSALIGCAIADGYIQQVTDPISQYLPQLKGQKHFDELSIRHLLNHTSGIRYNLEIDAQLYYGDDLLKGVEKIRFYCSPGTKQEYLNINTQLLGLLLKQVTQQSLSAYLSQKIWQPLGMDRDGSWNTDRVNQMEKCYCCMNATARDYAKFGRLYLHKGNWNGQQIIPQSWVEQSICRDTTEGSSHGYNYGWHIGLKEYGDFMAIGLYKQHIYIHPKKEIIMVLLNDGENKLKAERANWWYIFRQIVDQL